jgi:sugar-phosphatase
VELIDDGLADRLARPGAGLLVDLDGTLVRSEAVHQDAFRRYFAARGWVVEDDVVRQFSGRRAHEVFDELDGPWTGEDPHALTEGVLEVLRGTIVRPEPVPGAVRLLAACTRTGLPVAVVTSARREWTLAVLGMLGATDAAIALVTAEDCAHGKPDPEPFRRGAERLGRAADGLVAFEDAPAGISSACAAGVGHVIGVTTSHPAHVLRAAGAHATTMDLTAAAVAVERTVLHEGTAGA